MLHKKLHQYFYSWKLGDGSDCYSKMNGGISTIGEHFFHNGNYPIHILLSTGLVAKVLCGIWCGEYPESHVSSTEEITWEKGK